MELHVLHRHGWSISALAREFGLNWRTARRYATAPAPPRYARRCRPAELTPAQLAHVERRLAACPSLRGTVLLRELRELGYSASAASLRRRLRILRPAAMGEPLIRFETGPGIQSQGDWTDCGIWPLGTGSAALHAWVTVLGCSRMVALRFATDKTRATTLSAIVRCVDDLGGATAELLTDRDTALVVGSLPGGAPIFAPEWLDTAALLGTRPRACRPYRAKTKGKVERLNREIKEDFLAWLTGQVLPGRPTLADYDVAARRWALEVVAMRRHRTTGRIVGEAWEVDRVRDAGLQEVQRPAPRPFVVTQLPASIQALEDSVPRRIRR
ncbi:MAG: IS21 family transposase, partial [Candidatus Limnocylindria bacterium]